MALGPDAVQGEPPEAYEQRLTAEIEHYRSVEDVHDLPAIYDYWSRGHIDPMLRSVGIGSFLDIWLDPIQTVAKYDRSIRIVSLGSGNGDFELNLAKALLARGVTRFSIERLELNPHMRERAAQDAESQGISRYFHDQPADLNSWVPSGPYDIVMANHSLHHVVALEHLLGAVREALAEGGTFIVNDMIGRNGHMRWPEAAALVEAIWYIMPRRYRFNHQFSRLDEEFINWDCSADGFEGIRSQDILPLLNATFTPALFVAFANVIDPFVDRGYGPNFDPDSADDREFIDAVARLDEAALRLGIVKPTHLLARYQIEPVKCRFIEPFSPSFCERRVNVESKPVESKPTEDTSAVTGRPIIQWPTRGRGRLRDIAVEAASLVPPIRRLRADRNRLAAEVERLMAQIEKR